MICSHCGADNKDDAVKCTQCGEVLKSAADSNLKKKSNAALRIRKISVERVDSGSNSGRNRASEHTLEDVTKNSPNFVCCQKEPAVEDTLDLSNFHLENVELKELDLDDTDDTEHLGESNEPPKKKKKGLWITLGVLVVILIAAAAVLIYVWKNPKQDYADIILEGNRYYREADYGKAKGMYYKALKLNPDGVEGYFCLADVYLAMDDSKTAVEILNQGYKQTKNDQLKERIDELNSQGIIQESVEETGFPESTGEPETPSTVAPAADPKESAAGNTPALSGTGSLIQWSLEPELVADTIMPVLGCTPSEDIYTGDISMIVQNGQAGFINSGGLIILEPQYSYILKCSGGFYAGMADGSCAFLNGDYTVDKEKLHAHDQKSYSYLWDEDQKAVFRVVQSPEGTTVEAEPFKIEADTLVPVIAGTRENYSFENPVYALASNQGRCTDFIYENTGQCSWNGMMAVSRNGKWGFCSLEGVEIVPCEYDGADYMAITAEGVSYVSGAPYGYCGGYAALKKDSLWGFVDKSGNVVIPFIFDEARPVQGTNAWVKYQGKWGVISLADVVQAQ